MKVPAENFIAVVPQCRYYSFLFSTQVRLSRITSCTFFVQLSPEEMRFVRRHRNWARKLLRVITLAFRNLAHCQLRNAIRASPVQGAAYDLQFRNAKQVLAPLSRIQWAPMTAPDSNIPAVVVRLLDPNQGRPLQEWRFDSATEITIGRSEDRSIVIPDPQVSRLHVTLSLRDGKWWLVSQGKNGVLVDGKLVNEVPTGVELTFRMGANGPFMSFRLATAMAQTSSATVQGDEDGEWDDLLLDRSQLAEDVREITDGDFFQKLAEQANQFRQQK